MLDIRQIRNEPEKYREAMKKRGVDGVVIDDALALDERRRAMITEVEDLRRQRNENSKLVSQLKRDKKDAGKQIEATRQIGDKIKALEAERVKMDEQMDQMMMQLPNVPHESVPVGQDESANVLVKSWGELKEFDFEPLAHWDLGAALGVIDLERGAKISGSGFILFKGLGARLQRALISFMLDIHTREHGYTEVLPPFLVNARTMTGTGQLPKFEEDMYKCERDDIYLIPTAEVPITNLYRDEILPGEMLPVYHCGYSACFRREAGSAGKDTRGMIRVHQFDKVEMVKIVQPETSYDELEKMLVNAETVLQRLGLAYRVLALSSGDMGFCAAKCYDLEVWAPGVQRWLECSSCSNCEDFQARRMNTRFRDADGKPKYVHTLNGSGLALPRIFIALLEANQQADGSVVLPEAIRPYMDGVEVIEPENK